MRVKLSLPCLCSAALDSKLVVTKKFFTGTLLFPGYFPPKKAVFVLGRAKTNPETKGGWLPLKYSLLYVAS